MSILLAFVMLRHEATVSHRKISQGARFIIHTVTNTSTQHETDASCLSMTSIRSQTGLAQDYLLLYNSEAVSTAIYNHMVAVSRLSGTGTTSC